MVDKMGSRLHITPENLDTICGLITDQKLPQICLNDGRYTRELETCKERIVSAFERILPERSTYELF